MKKQNLVCILKDLPVKLSLIAEELDPPFH